MKVRVLGTAAGGGLPQWNCACEECNRAREDGADGLPPRSQDCLAVSGDGTVWYLVNASPDIRTQIVAAPELAPGPGRRETPLRGVLLTSAELDHTLGLMTLREGSDLAVYGTAPVLGALGEAFPVRRILASYGSVSWHPLRPAEPLALDARLWVTAVPLGAKRPRYAAADADARDGNAARTDWVVAYRFQDTRTGGAFVYAPCLAAWTPGFEDAVRSASVVLLDGTCYFDDEMRRRTGTGRTATAMGHLPIEESLPRLKAYPDTRWLFTHLNNTNPVLTPSSPEHAAVLGAGAEVAADGLTLEL